ncbi:DUF4381 domain-containing protein [Shewanella gelidimarina]|uniref:DUF4381 domain-containing protein n=1 Tax=Shewanella gelidimarina TaxID=56813 RepID=UPI00200F5CFD|nr:DUF4381 domain-containing protein [Shewanella gelidimarina]MCL1058914.1 DUF4381 domain-containing protein [Shewanella gelidimarina]
MNQVTQLVDIPLPNAIPWWPLAAGWYGVALVGLLFLLVLMYRKRQRWVADGYRRAALKQLQSLTLNDAGRMNQVIRNTAMSANLCDVKLSQTGALWYRAIINSSRNVIFTEAQLQQLERLNYQSATQALRYLSESDFSKLNQLCQRWVKEHHFEHQS